MEEMGRQSQLVFRMGRMKVGDVTPTVLTAAIVVMAIAIAARELREWRGDRASPPPMPVFDGRWRDALEHAFQRTNPAASVTLLEFVDMECPACRESHSAIRALAKKYGHRLSVAFVHYPLKTHAYARLGAFAVVCAGRQGRVDHAMDRIFEDQRLLSAFEASDFARSITIPRVDAFEACVADSTRIAEAQQGRSAGERMQLTGTPTIVINGWRFRGAVSQHYLAQAIDDLSAGRKPRFAEASGTRPFAPNDDALK